MTAFDPVAQAQTDQALDFASLDDLGRALARRVEKLAAAVDQAERDAQATDDLLVLAGCASMADLSAAQAQDCAACVLALLGKAHDKLSTRCWFLAQRAERHAARVARRWLQAKQRIGGAA